MFQSTSDGGPGGRIILLLVGAAVVIAVIEIFVGVRHFRNDLIEVGIQDALEMLGNAFGVAGGGEVGHQNAVFRCFHVRFACLRRGESGRGGLVGSGRLLLGGCPLLLRLGLAGVALGFHLAAGRQAKQQSQSD